MHDFIVIMMINGGYTFKCSRDSVTWRTLVASMQQFLLNICIQIGSGLYFNLYHGELLV